MLTHKNGSSTFLQKAVFQSDEQAIEILFQHKACPKTQCFNTFTFKNEPLLWYVKTPEIARLLVKNNVDIHATNTDYPNILWRTLHVNYSFEMMEFYLEKEVNARQLRPSDDSCLLHYASSINPNNNCREMFLKKVELLVKTIPDMINTLNVDGETPLDRAQNQLIQIKAKSIEKMNYFEQTIKDPENQKRFAEYIKYCELIKKAEPQLRDENIETIQNLITLFKNHGGKNAQEIVQQEMSQK